MLACCGLDCEKCDAFLATKLDDDAKRAATAAAWSAMFKAEIPAAAINCTGCTGTGVKFHHCEHGCEIRRCALGKNLPNCAPCAEYPCDRLTPIFGFDPDAKARLDAARG